MKVAVYFVFECTVWFVPVHFIFNRDGMLVPVFWPIGFWLLKTSYKPVLLAFVEILISSPVKFCNMWFLWWPYSII